MDLDLLERLAESAEADDRLGPDDLGPYLDASCEAMEELGTSAVRFECDADPARWAPNGSTPRFRPSKTAPPALRRLLSAIAERAIGAHEPDPRSRARDGLFVIDARRRPRATLHEARAWSTSYALDGVAPVLGPLLPWPARVLVLTYEWADDALQFLEGPREPGRPDTVPPAAVDWIRIRFSDAIRGLQPPGDVGWAGGFARINFATRSASGDLYALRIGTPLLTID